MKYTKSNNRKNKIPTILLIICISFTTISMIFNCLLAAKVKNNTIFSKIELPQINQPLKSTTVSTSPASAFCPEVNIQNGTFIFPNENSVSVKGDGLWVNINITKGNLEYFKSYIKENNLVFQVDGITYRASVFCSDVQPSVEEATVKWENLDSTTEDLVLYNEKNISGTNQYLVLYTAVDKNESNFGEIEDILQDMIQNVSISYDATVSLPEFLSNSETEPMAINCITTHMIAFETGDVIIQKYNSKAERSNLENLYNVKAPSEWFDLKDGEGHSLLLENERLFFFGR